MTIGYDFASVFSNHLTSMECKKGIKKAIDTNKNEAAENQNNLNEPSNNIIEVS
uniref:Uncharacterized protein n=1 Tax=Octopus bimaculoides TaxID=37653 RepID=A0A0L8GRF9_OCTBM